MASMMSLVVLLLALVLPALAQQVPYFMPHSSLNCSNTKDYLCRTGSCSEGNPGVNDTWAIPSIPAIDQSCACACSSYGTCTKTGIASIANTYAFYILQTASPAACCTACKKFPNFPLYQGGTVNYAFTATCGFWQWRTLANTPHASDGGYCYIYVKNPTNTLIPGCTGLKSGTTTLSYSTSIVTTVGAVCDSGNHDPHFIGHQGARFDFNGMPGETFCLITDANLHINMKLSGYLDSRMESAVKVVGGKAVRTWMRELGFMWTAAGKEHSLHLATRDGPQVERGDGYVALVKADGVELPRMQEKDELNLAGGLILRFVEIETEGPYTVEFYNLVINDILDMDLRVRVANAKLRTVEDAEVHFSFGINKLKTSTAVHGVLGQTYRLDREERNQDFAAQLRNFATFSADSDSGKGFLDGTTSDYSASGVLAPDCKFTTFNGRHIRTAVE